MLKPLLENDYHKKLINDARFIRGSRDIHYMFEALFKYRKCLYEVENVWSGLMECPMSVSMVYNATKTLYTKHIKGISETIDRMLVLLMDDDFDRSFTEEELLPFGYPDIHSVVAVAVGDVWLPTIFALPFITLYRLSQVTEIAILEILFARTGMVRHIQCAPAVAAVHIVRIAEAELRVDAWLLKLHELTSR